jgi:hypothetical protein
LLMKRLILLFSLLALLAPGVAQAVQFDPVMVTLDMPNQVVTAPTSGVTLVDFTGTVFVDSNYSIDFASLDFPFNSSSSNGLIGSFNAAFLTFASGGNGTYNGSLFDISVPAGTPPDLYAFQQATSNPALFTVHALPFAQAFGIDSPTGEVGASDSAAFSVLVNAPANGVPDGGSSVLLLGVGFAALAFTQRTFGKLKAIRY